MQRPFILGLVVVGALLLVAALALHLMGDRTEPAPVAAMPGAPAAAPPREAAQPRAPMPPSFDIVRVNPSGDAVIAGRAEPGAEVTVLDGDRVIGRATADSRGEWVLLPSEPLAPGHRELRLEAARPGAAPTRSDKAVALDVPSSGARQVASAPAATAADQQAVVTRGNSLWELARRRYGHGTEYTTIYQANRGQIRDPDLIYPGQVFVIPPER